MCLPEEVVMVTASSKAKPSCRRNVSGGKPGASYTGLLGHDKTRMLKEA